MDLLYQNNIIYIYEYVYKYLSLFFKRCKNYCIIVALCICYTLFNYDYSFSIKPKRQSSTNSGSSLEQQSEESSSSSEGEEGSTGGNSCNQFLSLYEQGLPFQEESISSKEFVDKAVQTGEDSSQSSSQSSESIPSPGAVPSAPDIFFSASEGVEEVVIVSSEESMQQEVVNGLEEKVKKLKKKLQEERKIHQEKIDNLKACAVRQIQFLQHMLKVAQHQAQKVEIEKLEAQQLVALFQEALLKQEGESQSSTRQQASTSVPSHHREESKSPPPLSKEDEDSDDSMPPLEGEEGDIWRDQYVSSVRTSQSSQQQVPSSSEAFQTNLVGSSRVLSPVQEEDEGSCHSSIGGYSSGSALSVLIVEEGSSSDLEKSVKSLSEHPSGSDSDTLESGEVVGEEVKSPLATMWSSPSSSSGQSSSSDSSGEDSSPQVKRRRLGSSSFKFPGSPSSRDDMSLMLIPGYNHESQYGSLKGLQCVLLGAVEQMSTNLKTLVLKTSLYLAGTKGKKTSSLIARESKKTCISLCGKEASAKNIMKNDSSNLLLLLSTCHLFGYTDSYLSNQENKVSSGKVGLLMNPISNVSIGLTYNRYKNHGKEYHGSQLDTSFGSAKANMEIDGFSAVVAWNSEEKGLTGYLSGCHNWGQMKNTRRVMQAGKETRTKGSPDAQLSGVLGQFGYTFPLSKNISCVPYIEATHIVVKWKQYKEDSGFLPCMVSGYREQFQEKTIGLRTSMEITDKAILQTWVSGGTVQHITSNITSIPLASPLLLYKTSVPRNKKKSFYSEYGTLYEMNVTDFCKVDLHGSLRLKKNQKLDTCQMRLHFQYLF